MGASTSMCAYLLIFPTPSQVGDEIEVFGPDVVTSCGQLGRVLEVVTVYVAGIGGPCNPISEWTEYCPQDVELQVVRAAPHNCYHSHSHAPNNTTPPAVWLFYENLRLLHTPYSGGLLERLVLSRENST